LTYSALQVVEFISTSDGEAVDRIRQRKGAENMDVLHSCASLLLEKERISREEFEKRNVFGTGAENTGFAQYFIGNSYLNPLTDPKNCAVFMANVTFEPGCRNNWHIHHAAKGGGQLLICTAGEGWYQEE